MSKNKIILAIVVLLLVVGGGYFLFPNEFISESQMIANGEAYQKTGKTALALKVYQRTVERFPDSYNARVHLGNALLEVDESDLARKQFDSAINLKKGNARETAAQVAVVKMLIADNKYQDAEKTILSLGDKIPKELKLLLGDLYVEWATEKYNANDKEAVKEKFKLAYESYNGLDSAKTQNVKERIFQIYEDIANKYLVDNKQAKAIEVLKEAITFEKSPKVYMMLAQIYKKQNKFDEAIEIYSDIYESDTTGASTLYLSELLVDKGAGLLSKKKFSEARECFEKAQEVNPSIIIPAEVLYSVDLRKIAAKFIKSSSSSFISPQIAFKLSNDSNEKISFMNVKVEFYNDGKLVGEDIKSIIKNDKPLAAKKTTGLIKFSYPMGLDLMKKAYNIQAKIYLANSDIGSWNIARTVNLSTKKKVKQKEQAANPMKIVKKKNVVSNKTRQPLRELTSDEVSQAANNSSYPAPQTIATKVVDRSGSVENSHNKLQPDNQLQSPPPAPLTISDPKPALVPIGTGYQSSGNMTLPPMQSE